MSVVVVATIRPLPRHANGPNLAALGPRLAGKMTGAPEVAVLCPGSAGDPARGTIEIHSANEPADVTLM